ncbi:MAG: AAA family ATPase, partial [Myxococcaceae bacterium]
EAAGWKLEGSSGAAALLGLKPSTLRSRMQKLDIRRPS